MKPDPARLGWSDRWRISAAAFFVRFGRWLVAAVAAFIAVWLLSRLIGFVAKLPDTQGKTVVALVQSLAWPVAVLAAITVLAKPIGGFLGGLGSRITKLTVFDVGIEVAELQKFEPDWVTQNMDFRRISPRYIFDSYSITLFKQLAETSPADFVVVDLANGKQWLTSRLFLFSIMLQRFRGVRAFVFLEDRPGVLGAYLGAASTDRIRWTLARRYPWLEAAFARAYADVLLPPANAWPDASLAFTENGAMDQHTASRIAERFLELIQHPAAPPDPHQQEEWISIGDPPTLYERAHWIDGPLLRDLAGEHLQRDSTTLPPLASAEEQIFKVADRESSVVAITGPDGRFRSLVDRTALLDEIAVRTLSQQRRAGGA